MSCDLEQLEAFLDEVRATRSCLKKAKKAACNCKQQERANVLFRQVERHMHELHCLAVGLGIAAPEEWRYGEKKIQMTMGRETIELRRRPQGV